MRRPFLVLAVCLGALALSAQARDRVYYYYTDALHSAVVETDATGAVLERTNYAPYGQVLNRVLRDGPGYTGHAEDPETDLVYMQQRYYDPESGRFLSTDPVQADGGGGSFNRYWYANDNPYRYTDPFGMCTGSHISNSDGSCASTGGFTTGTNGAAQGMRREQAMRNALAKYRSVINYGHINVPANVHEAEKLGRHHDLIGFIKRVKPHGIWDFKHLSVFTGFPDRDLLQEFGNFHFGLVAHAFGFTEGMAIMGAGLVQTFWQGHRVGYRLSGRTDFAVSASFITTTTLPIYLGSDKAAAAAAGLGMRFGDYPEDTAAIMSGYSYYGAHYGH